jgi:hypothetical protein
MELTFSSASGSSRFYRLLASPSFRHWPREGLLALAARDFSSSPSAPFVFSIFLFPGVSSVVSLLSRSNPPCQDAALSPTADMPSSHRPSYSPP